MSPDRRCAGASEDCRNNKQPLMLVGLRDRLVRNRTQLSNAIRGYAAEFGFTSARSWRTSIRCSIAFKLTRACPGSRAVRGAG